MKKLIFPFLIMVVAAGVYAYRHSDSPGGTEPWTEQQLMEPALLAEMMKESPKKVPVIIGVGPGGGIKGAMEFGPSNDKENYEKLKAYLSGLPKDTNLVLYCGCCPFVHCPNIRPAFKLMNDLKFTNHKLLNLPKNLKVNWIDKGYPAIK